MTPPRHGFTGRITTWYAMATPKSQQRIPIRPMWPEHWEIADTLSKLSKARKPGSNIVASHHQLNSENLIVTERREKRPETYRKCESSLYTLPPKDSFDESSSTPLPQTAYIFAQTSRAFPYGKPMSHRKSFPFIFENYHVWLMTSEGQHWGYLQLNSADEMHLFKNEFSPLHTIELVATCKGYTRDIFSVGEDWDQVIAEKIRSREHPYYSESKVYESNEI
jgi:hypothetical protein